MRFSSRIVQALRIAVSFIFVLVMGVVALRVSAERGHAAGYGQEAQKSRETTPGACVYQLDRSKPLPPQNPAAGLAYGLYCLDADEGQYSQATLAVGARQLIVWPQAGLVIPWPAGKTARQALLDWAKEQKP